LLMAQSMYLLVTSVFGPKVSGCKAQDCTGTYKPGVM
jgi:hypothetical protein